MTEPSEKQNTIDISNELHPQEKNIIQLTSEKDSTIRDINVLWTLQEQLLEKLSIQKRELHDKQRSLAMKHRKEIMDFDLECLETENEKMSKYLEILKKKHEIEISYLDEMYKYKKSITDISNANVEIEHEKIPSIQETFNFELVKIFPMKKRTKSIPSSEISQPQTFEPINAIAPIQSLIPVQNQEIINTNTKPTPPPPPLPRPQSHPQPQPQPNRAQINISNLDRTRLKKPSEPERRHSMPGSLESHLREALSTKFAGVFETMKKDGVIDDSDDDADKWH